MMRWLKNIKSTKINKLITISGYGIIPFFLIRLDLLMYFHTYVIATIFIVGSVFYFVQSILLFYNDLDDEDLDYPPFLLLLALFFINYISIPVTRSVLESTFSVFRYHNQQDVLFLLYILYLVWFWIFSICLGFKIYKKFF